MVSTAGTRGGSPHTDRVDSARVITDPDRFRLVTERAVIRPWRASDAPLLFDIRRRPDIAQWLDHPEPWPSETYTRQRIERWRDEATERVPGPCAIVPSACAQPVGGVSLSALPLSGRIGADDPGLAVLSTEVGYAVGW